MKLDLDMVKRVVDVFYGGFKAQLVDDSTYVVSLSVGVYQGLKYNGSLKRGITAGVTMVGVLGAVNGVQSVFKNAAYIRQDIKIGSNK